jgi:Prophage CP4-57 regulatory protein (AlpA)
MSKSNQQHHSAPPAAQAPAGDRRLIRFAHLKARGICENRERLAYLIEKQDFPRGFWTGPNSHVWWEHEVDAWLKSCPTERPATNQANPPRKRKEAVEGGTT